MTTTVHAADKQDTAVYTAEEATEAGVLKTPTGRHTISKGDWVVTHEGGGQRVYSAAQFNARFKRGAPAGMSTAPAPKKAEG